MQYRAVRLTVIAAVATAVLAAAAGERTLPLRYLLDIPVKPAGAEFAGRTPRMDYETIDPGRRMLYLAYLGANEVVAFDLETNKVVAHVQGLDGVHGMLAIPELHRVYASATGSNQVAAIDENSLKVTARADGGDYPDGMAYDEGDQKVFVSDEHGGTDTVVDVRTNRTVDKVDLGGEAGNTQYDALRHRVYSDVQTRDDVVAIDPKADKIAARHALEGCEHDHGLLLDDVHRLAFVACDGNAKLLVMNLDSWKELATFPVGNDPDVLAFDQGLRRLYVAAESGVVAVFEEEAGTVKPLGSGFLADEAHTVAVDPKTHKLYFALQNVGGRAVIRVMEPTP